MGKKLTAEERAALEKQLADDDATDDDDDGSDDVEIGRADGSYFRGTYARAKKLGYVTEPAAEDDSAAKGGKQGGAKGGQEGNVRRFSGRRVS